MKKFTILFLTGIVFSYTLKGQCDIRMDDIYTPKGNLVVTFLMCESSNSVRDYWDKKIANDFPDARQIKDPINAPYSSTRKYNCHGYAWLKVEQDISRWIGTGWSNDITDPEKIYITDGSYVEVPQATYPGKVFWASGDHSAVTTNQQGRFISKWNEYPLVEHAWDDSPYGTSNLKYYIIRPTITGPSLVCSSSTFTATNWQPGYTWVTSSNIAISTYYGNTNPIISVGQKTNNYEPGSLGWITVRNSSGKELFRKEVWVGSPSPTIYGPENITISTYNGSATESYMASNNPLSNPSSFYWSMVTGPSYDLGYSGNSAYVSFYSGGNYQLSVAASNTCGHSQAYPATKDIYVYVYYGSSASPVASYPNPASSILNIEIDAAVIAQAQSLQPTTTGAKQLKIDPTYDIRLYDGQGNLLRNAKTKGGTVQFNVANLTNGIYYLHIYDGTGDKPEMRQIVVEH